MLSYDVTNHKLAIYTVLPIYPSDHLSQNVRKLGTLCIGTKISKLFVSMLKNQENGELRLEIILMFCYAGAFYVLILFFRCKSYIFKA